MYYLLNIYVDQLLVVYLQMSLEFKYRVTSVHNTNEFNANLRGYVQAKGKIQSLPTHPHADGQLGEVS